MGKETSVYKLEELWKEANKDLCVKADYERKRCVGDDVFVRGLIEFSNYCSKNCLYCGLRMDNSKLKRYRMDIQEIENTICEGIRFGFKSFVLQSGEDLYFKSNLKRFCEMIQRIKSKHDIRITLSMGVLDEISLRDLKNAGADRYLLKFETSDERLYRFLKPDSNYGDRFDCLEVLKKLNYQVGSGIIVGLPAQNDDMVLNDINRILSFNLDMISISPFVSNPDTPLSVFKNCRENLFLKTIAITRILNSFSHIPTTTAAEVLYKNGRKKALKYGANVLMINLTPQIYYENYLIYLKREKFYSFDLKVKKLEKMIKKISRNFNLGFGDSFLWKKHQNQ